MVIKIYLKKNINKIYEILKSKICSQNSLVSNNNYYQYWHENIVLATTEKMIEEYSIYIYQLDYIKILINKLKHWNFNIFLTITKNNLWTSKISQSWHY